MKNVVICMVLFLGFFVLFACSTAQPASEPAPAPTPATAPAQTPATAPAPTPVAAPTTPPVAPVPPERAHALVLDGAELYTVIIADTLSHIARLKYGAVNGYFYPLIIMASRDIVEDQDLIEPNTVLTIPDLQANLADARARASMKNFFLEIAEITEREHKRPIDSVELRKLAATF